MPLGIIFVLHSSFTWSSKFSGSKYRRLNSLTSTRSSWPLTFCSWNYYYDKPGLFRITHKTLRQRRNCREGHTGFAPDNLPCLFLPEGQTCIKSYLDLIQIWGTLNDKFTWGHLSAFNNCQQLAKVWPPYGFRLFMVCFCICTCIFQHIFGCIHSNMFTCIYLIRSVKTLVELYSLWEEPLKHVFNYQWHPLSKPETISF